MGRVGERRVVLLDVMGTLVHDPFYDVFPAFFGVPLSELVRALHPSAWVEFERGELTESEFLGRLFRDGRAYDAAALRERMFGAYRWLEGTRELCVELRGLGYELHALSNYPVWFEQIEARLGLSELAPWTFVSCRTRVRKPEAEAFVGAARTLAVPASACIVVDDRPVNCEAARAVGMRAFRFRGAAALRDELRAAGLLRAWLRRTSSPRRRAP